MRTVLLFLCLLSWGTLNLHAGPAPVPTFEVMTGKAAEEKIRLLYEGASEENPFLFQGTTPEGKPCTLSFFTPSESEFVVSMSLTRSEEVVAKVVISKMATVSRATRAFDSYLSEHYKLFIPSGSYDILEHRKRHDGSEYQLVFQSSLDQNKWCACGKFKDLPF